jgi:two-component system, cell cycle sensor histidine kinase PleC
MTVGANIEAAMPGSRAAARGSVQRSVERALFRMGPAKSTAVLVFCGVLFAELIHLAIRLVAHPLFDRSMLICATLVTVVVAAPITYYSQLLIRRLVRSRRGLGDLTEKLAVALDEAQAANEAKSRFFANANHELRTPLNAIIGFSQMLTAQSLGPIGVPRYAEYADDIHRSAQHLLALVNDLLELARGQTPDGKRDSDGECDLRQAIDDALRMVWPAAERGGVRLERRIDDRIRGLRANDRMVKQILLNLLSNAVKFSPNGVVRVTARIASDGRLTVETTDTGIGMSPTDIAVALTPFGQVANAITRREAGTGLGLPLAKAMMEMHDGTLRLESEIGRGTVVTLSFPAARVTAARTAPVAEALVGA